MNYNKRFLEDGSYVIEEVASSGWIRVISERQPDFLSWIYAGNKPTEIPYVPIETIPLTLDEVKRNKRNELMRLRDEVIAEGFPHKENLFPIDEKIQVTMMATYLQAKEVALNDVLKNVVSFTWKNMDGVYVTIGLAKDFENFALAAMNYGSAQFAREEMLQGLVNAAKTLEEVKSISWNTIPKNPV